MVGLRYYSIPTLQLRQRRVVQSLTEPFGMGGNPVGIEGAPVTDDVGTDIVARSLAVLELADNIQLAQGGKGVLGGAPGHTGGGCHGGDAGDTKRDQVGHIRSEEHTSELQSRPHLV